MSYQVLARKWRPQNFKEMVGQQHVLQALSNALDEERLHHAYLFTGTRGVGKTTIARILVKCLNCETGITSEPCGTCSSCTEIAEGRFLDLIEVDAASRTKVEDTRELLENVHYAPSRGRFKVYLIDEVHMLSGHSFNALLKTLEEPPPHVKFLFATTDPQKLPVTILSRCLQFNLKRMPIDLITGHLKTILKADKTDFDEPSLRLLARGADGSMRDALSLMDQAIGYGAGALKEAEVREMMGTISHDWLSTLLTAANAGNGKKLIETVEDMAGQVPDFEAAADGLISMLHQIAVRQAVPEIEHDDDIVTQLASQLSSENTQLYYQIAIQARRDLPLSPDPRAGFEMLLLRMMSFRPLTAVENLNDNQETLDTIRDTISNADNPAAQQITEPTSESVKSPKKKLSDSPETRNNLQPDQSQEVNPNHIAKEADHLTAMESSPVKNSTVAPTITPTIAPTITPTIAPPTSKPYDKKLSPEVPTSPQTTQASQTQNATISDETLNKSGEWDWHKIIAELELKDVLKGMASQLANHCLLDKYETGIVHLTLDAEGEGLLSSSAEADLRSALSSYFEEPVKLNITATKITTETPDKRRVRLENERQQAAEQKIADDPFVQELQKELDATIVTGSIKIKEK